MKNISILNKKKNTIIIIELIIACVLSIFLKYMHDFYAMGHMGLTKVMGEYVAGSDTGELVFDLRDTDPSNAIICLTESTDHLKGFQSPMEYRQLSKEELEQGISSGNDTLLMIRLILSEDTPKTLGLTGNYHYLYISATETIQRFLFMRMVIESLAVGILIQLFVVHIFLFCNMPENRYNLYFAILCLLFAVRTGFIEHHILYALLPGLSWDISTRIELITLPVTLIIFFLMIRDVQRSDLRKKVDSNRKNPIVVFMSLGTVVVIYSAIHDALYYNTDIVLFPDLPITDVFLFIYAILHMVVFMDTTMSSIRESAVKEAALTAERDMLAHLNSLKNEFYADISHEMKTPLTLISMNSQFAAKRIRAGAISEDMADDLDAASKEARRLAEMVTGLVELGRFQSVPDNEDMVDMAELVREIIKVYTPMYDRYGNSIQLEMGDVSPVVRCDRDQLMQVFINIFTNANRHTRNGVISCNMGIRDGYAEVSIDDTGEGIDPEVLPHVFDRFYKGNGGNVGLGLYICRSIIEKYNGHIGIDSKKGSGTRLWFTLPVKD